MPLHPILALDQVIDEYRSYLRSEFRAKDPALNVALETELDRPLFLAQEPFYQAHRPFVSAKHWDDLPLDAKLARTMTQRTAGFPAYLHQSGAIDELLAPTARPVVVTTGTGSGKTEAFLLPVIQNAIDDAVAFRQSGLTAILVYPMNALANDQLERINQYLDASDFSGTVSVAKYDRSTRQDEREQLRRNPPHILLTNYMMLEYLLVRPADRDDIFANHRCRFLVLDEVHTYRGTLGTNIALLIRRLRAHLQRARQDWRTDVPTDQHARRFPSLVSVGTSATIKSVSEEGITRAEAVALRDRAVQDFFGKLVGVAPDTIQIFGEEIETVDIPADAQYASAVPISVTVDTSDPNSVRRALCNLAGLDPATPLAKAARRCRLLWDLNRWLAKQPLSISQLAVKVQAEVPDRQSESEATLRHEIETALVAGAALPDNVPGALRLRAHRFIRGGWHFHRCLNPACGRLYPMGEERCADCGYDTAPLHLCRNCGADYLQLAGEPAEGLLHPYRRGVDDEEWMLYYPDKFETRADDDDDLDEDDDLALARRSRRRRASTPTQMRRRPVLHGSFDSRSRMFSTDPTEYHDQVILAPARTKCLCCGGTAGSRNVVSPLSIGTSAALKVMSEGVLDSLDEVHKAESAADHKERLLIFCDSRQDAAHQARFIIFASRYDRMRRRLVRLLQEQGPLTIQRAVELLGDEAVRNRDNPNLPDNPRARISADRLAQIQAYEEAPLLDDIAITAGYRGTLLNLGLVGVQYEGLAAWIDGEEGQAVARELDISPADLTHICRSLLDEMRIRGALSRPMLRYHPRHPACPRYVQAAQWERSVPVAQGYASDPDDAPALYLDRDTIPSGINARNNWRRPGAGGRPPRPAVIFSRLLKRYGRAADDITEDDMLAVLELLALGSYIVPVTLFGYRDTANLYQVDEETLHLALLSESQRMRCNICSAPLPFASPNAPCPACDHGHAVPWLDADIAQHRSVQRIRSAHTVPLIAAEHSAQVPGSVREELEAAFKAPQSEAKLNLLACSPTLEMGIDVGGLDAVALRNVPPRPDNYAQRGGRAGRRSRVGLVLGYARSTPHDQYFYDKPAEMIAGEVPAPAIALQNRDVILRHINAIVFGAADPGLSGKMVDYITAQGDLEEEAVQELLAGVQAQFGYARQMATEAFGPDVLQAAGLDAAALQAHFASLPGQIEDVFDRTRRQVIELRQALEKYAAQLQDARAGLHAGEMVARMLGIRSNNDTADDRSSGYPLRRFAEFGILPGYEFPTEPASLRLLGDDNEQDPLSVGRTYGLAQFQPDAQVYARGKRWKVIGLDTASPWNPQSDDPSWLYRICRRCELHFDAFEPRCPRCGDTDPGHPKPAFAYGGFVARRDEAPVLNEEDRIAMRNLVQAYPQWNGPITGRWRAGDWQLQLRTQEEVRWLNEGLPPSQRALDNNVPTLTADATGFLLCNSCGAMLKFPEPESASSRGRANTRTAARTAADYGHHRDCPKAHEAPVPAALMTDGLTEVLRLVTAVPASTRSADIASWALSLGYALHAGMCQLYTLDGTEIEFVYEGAWTEHRDTGPIGYVALTFIDPSIGGTGYLERIARDFHLVARRTLEHLDHGYCETACYRCLKSYTNQRYHDQLEWPLTLPDLEALAAEAPIRQPLELGDVDDPGPWLAAYEAGLGSPLELKFWQLFQQHDFHPEKQHAITLPGRQRPLTIPDFALPDARVAIYIDGASVHTGRNTRRDRYIRNRLRELDDPWTVVELRAHDLHQGHALVTMLKSLDRP